MLGGNILTWINGLTKLAVNKNKEIIFRLATCKQCGDVGSMLVQQLLTIYNNAVELSKCIASMCG